MLTTASDDIVTVIDGGLVSQKVLGMQVLAGVRFVILL
jgi:hypothetical protein